MLARRAWIAAALVLPLLWATPARAHGGRFIPPRPPLGPPPAPRIPDAPPATTPPNGPTPPAPPTVTPPTVPPTTAPPAAGGGPFGSGPGRRAVPVSDPNAAWQTWWNLNRLAYLPDRDEVWARRPVTPNEGDDPLFWSRRRAEVGEQQVVPFLLGLTDPAAGMRDDVVSSALIALAKVSHQPVVVDAVLTRLEDRRASVLVRESAALAAGYLRRSDPERQMDAVRLDALRERLLDASEDASLATRARAFAVLSVGMLGDQPFSSPYTKDGRLVVHRLWQGLRRDHAQRDVPIAQLTALGLQPPAGVPDGVREGLRRMVAGKSVLGRRWDAVERGHALTAALRLGGPASHALLVRVLRMPRTDREVRQAAFLALGAVAARMDAAERLEATEAVRQALKRARDPLSKGLGHLGLGQLLGADLRAGSTDVLLKGGTDRELLAEARSGATPTRGFSALALGLALQDVRSEERTVRGFVEAGRTLLLRELARGTTAPPLRAAYAVAVGLAGADARETLDGIVRDRTLDPELRGHAAVSLGWLGPPGPETERALNLALAEPASLELRRQAALGLALLGSRIAQPQLLRQLAAGRTERLLAQVVVALGRLGDLEAVGPLKRFASDAGRSELSQALAAVALGLIVDPEPRPSLLRLTWNGFYPARTDSLDEAYTIL